MPSSWPRCTPSAAGLSNQHGMPSSTHFRGTKDIAAYYTSRTGTVLLEVSWWRASSPGLNKTDTGRALWGRSGRDPRVGLPFSRRLQVPSDTRSARVMRRCVDPRDAEPTARDTLLRARRLEAAPDDRGHRLHPFVTPGSASRESCAEHYRAPLPAAASSATIAPGSISSRKSSPHPLRTFPRLARCLVLDRVKPACSSHEQLIPCR